MNLNHSRGFILILTLLLMTMFALLGTVQISQSLQASLRVKNALNRSQATQIADFAVQQGSLWLNSTVGKTAATCTNSAGACSTLYAPSLSAAGVSQDPTNTAWSGWGAKARTVNLNTGQSRFPKYPNAIAYFVIELMSRKTDGDGNVWPTYRITGFGQTDTTATASKATSVLNMTPSNTFAAMGSCLYLLNNYNQSSLTNTNRVQVMFKVIKDQQAPNGSVDFNCNYIYQDSRNDNPSSTDYAYIPMNSQWMFIDSSLGSNGWSNNRLINAPQGERLRASNSVCPDTTGANSNCGGNRCAGISAICQVNATGQVRVGVLSNYDVYNNSNNYGGNYANSEGNDSANYYNSQHNPACDYSYGPWSSGTSTLEIPTAWYENVWQGGQCTYNYKTQCPDPTDTLPQLVK